MSIGGAIIDGFSIFLHENVRNFAVIWVLDVILFVFKTSKEHILLLRLCFPWTGSSRGFGRGTIRRFCYIIYI